VSKLKMVFGRLVPKDLFKALQLLKYERVSEVSNIGIKASYRKGRFHLIIKQGKKRTIIHIHKDLPSFLPIHQTRYRGKDLQEELRKIIQLYLQIRSEKKN